ncbi:hypothetical protein [Flavobacterium eburneipallidum]|uniref:hypothetical protein n=1 Tax=Flavobacterium eburneipallidum TaxID=3003263 RepID=UPI0022AC6A6A|nr:hypothetical protein [Flavobacterium eburneipallidum]
MSEVVLIIIYNHKYDKNIEILEQIYKDRFSNIYHLIPFYTGEKKNVIPVYESSYNFQGYVSQGFKTYFKEEYKHYFFVADDLILNPIINETNYSQHLHLKSKTSFVPETIGLHERGEFWTHVVKAFNWNVNLPGVEAKNELPDYATALQLFSNFGLEIKPLTYLQLYKKQEFPGLAKIKKFQSYYSWKKTLIENKNKEFHLSYPLISSYSDVFVISADSIKQFIHYCGVFASTGLFVEIAIPTAIVLSADEIVIEKDLELKGGALWTPEQCEILDKYDRKLELLLNDFPEKLLYLHPIKLSKWNTAL